MRGFHTFIYSLFLSTLCVLPSCGSGGGGGSDDPPAPLVEPPGAFDIESYDEYTQGTNLTGIWVLIQDTTDNFLISHDGYNSTSGQLRNILAMREYPDFGTEVGSSPSLDIACLYALHPNNVNVVHSGNQIDITLATGGELHLTASSSSRISGTFRSESSGSLIEGNVELVKIAALPVENSVAARFPVLGSLSATGGRWDGSTLTQNYVYHDNTPVNCLLHSKGELPVDEFGEDGYEDAAVVLDQDNLAVFKRVQSRVYIQGAVDASVTDAAGADHITFDGIRDFSITFGMDMLSIEASLNF